MSIIDFDFAGDFGHVPFSEVDNDYLAEFGDAFDQYYSNEE